MTNCLHEHTEWIAPGKKKFPARKMFGGIGNVCEDNFTPACRMGRNTRFDMRKF